MRLSSIEDVDVAGKAVLVRGDLEGELTSPRLLATKTLVEYLKSKSAERIKVIGHESSIALVDFLGTDVNWDLRADPRERENSSEFAQELAYGFDVYINEAFGTSHRKHTSIDALPRFMKSQNLPVVIGMRFKKELEMLSPVCDYTREGRVAVIGGIKVEDKSRYTRLLHKQGWTVLIGGLLPGADLREDKLDISVEAIEQYKKIIARAKLISTAGVMGKFEDPNSERGTKEILQAIADTHVYKIAGGGDVEKAISQFGLTDKFNWVSVGGGAMLEYLTSRTLVGMEALV